MAAACVCIGDGDSRPSVAATPPAAAAGAGVGACTLAGEAGSCLPAEASRFIGVVSRCFCRHVDFFC